MVMQPVGKGFLRRGLAAGLLWLALVALAQAQPGSDDVARRARLAAEEAIAAVAQAESGEVPSLKYTDASVTRQALAGSYRIDEDRFAGSLLQLGADGDYSLHLTLPPLHRAMKGKWELQDGAVLLHPQDDRADAVQLVPHEARSAEHARLQQLLADLQQAHQDPADHSGTDGRGELQALLATTHEVGRPLHVTLDDPMSGIASEGVQVVLELAQGELPAEGKLPGENTYRFPSPAAGQVVVGLRLQFPGMDAPLRLPLPPPLRPSYQVLFDACAVGMCESAAMILLLEQDGDAARLHALDVGVFERVND